MSKVEDIGIIPDLLTLPIVGFIPINELADEGDKIDPDVSDSEVKKAYREMAKKYHPDKLVTDDPALKKGAQEKFQEVQKAYEIIQKERGI